MRRFSVAVGQSPFDSNAEKPVEQHSRFVQAADSGLTRHRGTLSAPGISWTQHDAFHPPPGRVAVSAAGRACARLVGRLATPKSGDTTNWQHSVGERTSCPFKQMRIAGLCDLVGPAIDLTAGAAIQCNPSPRLRPRLSRKRESEVQQKGRFDTLCESSGRIGIGEHQSHRHADTPVRSTPSVRPSAGSAASSLRSRLE